MNESDPIILHGFCAQTESVRVYLNKVTAVVVHISFLLLLLGRSMLAARASFLLLVLAAPLWRPPPARSDLPSFRLLSERCASGRRLKISRLANTALSVAVLNFLRRLLQVRCDATCVKSIRGEFAREASIDSGAKLLQIRGHRRDAENNCLASEKKRHTAPT